MSITGVITHFNSPWVVRHQVAMGFRLFLQLRAASRRRRASEKMCLESQGMPRDQFLSFFGSSLLVGQERYVFFFFLGHTIHGLSIII